MGKMFNNLSVKINKKLWYLKLKRLHPKFFNFKGDLNKFRLILGPGRSGTSWVTKILGRSETPIWVIMELFHPLKIKIFFTNKYDRVSLPYKETIDKSNQIIKTFTMLTYPNDYNWSKIFSNNKIIRNDKNFKLCLFKEVHSLLIVKALMKNLKCPAIFITRNPIYVVGSHLSLAGYGAPGGMNESEHIMDPIF